MVQLPALLTVTTDPAMLQLPAALKRTDSPEEAVAVTANCGSPTVLSAGGLKSIVWLAFAIWNARVTGAAALKLAFPGCSAVIEQLPAPVSVTVVPAIVQFPDALKVTGKPELAVAFTENGAFP
jgi:hypothetical protein